MRKIVLLAVACCLWQMAAAQVEYTAGVSAAWRFPFIINQNAYGNTELEYRLTQGFGTGVKGGVMLHNRMFSFFAEANYGMYGQNYEDIIVNGNNGQADVNARREVRLSYWEFPVMFRYASDYRGHWGTFYGMAGVQYMILKDADITYTYDGERRSPFPPELATNNYNVAFRKNDLGFLFDVGYLKALGKTQNFEITAGIRGYYGFWDINAPAYRIPNSKGIYDKSLNTYGALHVSAAYIFGKGR